MKYIPLSLVRFASERLVELVVYDDRDHMEYMAVQKNNRNDNKKF